MIRSIGMHTRYVLHVGAAVALAAVFFFCGDGICFAGHIEDLCHQKTDSNAAYRQCVATETEVRIAPMVTAGLFKACGRDGGCIYRLVFDKSRNSYESPDFSISYSTAENGRRITIRATKGAVSTFFQCGTCNYLEYESGPILEADVKSAGNDTILLSVR